MFEKSEQTMSELRDIVLNIPSPWRMTICAGAGKLLGDLYMIEIAIYEKVEAHIRIKYPELASKMN
ncbi:MAG: hypothetical protein FWG71_09135 [Synergistaceae bacterium]|nr:hypothetical protein [Synergistaceae bacterium]